jgi:hypothetical protein
MINFQVFWQNYYISNQNNCDSLILGLKIVDVMWIYDNGVV